MIDVAKAIAAVRGGRVAALPTTLSGAEMTRIHRLPEGHAAADGLLRPELVLADPPVITSLPERRLRASAMNALAHGADSLYTPLANPVSKMSALRGAGLIAKALDAAAGERDPAALALGSILCAYALDSALFAPPPRDLPDARPDAANPARGDQRGDPAAGDRGADPARRHADDRARPRRWARGATGSASGSRSSPAAGGGSPSSAPTRAARRGGRAILARPELELTPDLPGEREIRGLIDGAW